MTEDGENRSLTGAQSQICEECNSEAMDSGIEDLVNISDLNEMAILHNLRIRFKEDKIYTYISSILISVNPFKQLPLYTPEILERYRGGSRGKPPHVFAAANNSYANMLSEAHDQSVVISGESGAGKSEATKLILQFLTDVSHKASAAVQTSTSGPISNLEAQILAANPILEAFGNAKTLRNNNSSRFGKLITVNFDQKGSIVGGGIINYLLEKSRVVFQTAGERNYHIFYQLLSAAETDPAMTSEMKLQAPELFAFTSKSGVTHVDGISDDKDFDEMRNSMNILQFPPDIQHEVFRIVAGVLHFGNLKFREVKNSTAEDGSEITNEDILQHACSLWGCDKNEMIQFLTHRRVGTKADIVLVSYSVSQAMDARDAMVKRVYSELFQYLVDKINVELSHAGAPRHKFIGVLDIFGFESFLINSFEQLCINFCNEKLQFHFNEHIFKMEQALYSSEGISIPGSSFVDNQPTLDLLEARGVGVFSMIDEEINVPRGSDDGLLQKIFQKHADGKHPNMIRPSKKDVKDFLKSFGIQHYAGPVFYHVDKFLEKNKDQLHPDIVGVLQASNSVLVHKFFPVEDAAAAGAKTGKSGAAAASAKKTLGFQFKTQLNDLIATLNTTFPHFVRCMKSNDLKSGNVFNSSRMQDQLRYAGLVEVCRIRKLGFPVRRPFIEFYKRYRCMDLLSPDLDTLLKSLSKKGVLKDGEWAKGHTRVFMRTLQSYQLEVAREQSLIGIAVLVQKHGRKMIGIRKYKYYKKIITDIRGAIVNRVEEPLVALLEASFELPFNGGQVQVVQEAKVLVARIKEEKRVTKLLENAIVTRDINSLKNAIVVHASMTPPYPIPEAQAAKELLARLEEELIIKAALTQAISARDRQKLAELVARAKIMDFDCNEITQAVAVIARLDQELVLVKQLAAAIAKEDLDELNATFSECMQNGMETYYPKEMANAKQVQVVLHEREMAKLAERKKREAEEEERRRKLAEIEAKRNAQISAARTALQTAIASKDINQLNIALQEAISSGVQISEVDEARAVLEAQKNLQTARLQLQAAMKVLITKVETGISELDLQPLIFSVDAAEKVCVAYRFIVCIVYFNRHLCRWHVQLETSMRSLMPVKSSSHTRSLLRQRLSWSKQLL